MPAILNKNDKPQTSSPAKKGKPAVKMAADAPRKVIYPEIKCTLFITGSERGPLTAALAKKFLGWETEKEFIARMIGENPELTPEACAKEFANHWIFKDEEGNKVACWNNAGNREFKDDRCQQYIQDILQRAWADSRMGEGMTFNGENIILTNTGKIDDGQKRLAALPRAVQRWQRNPKAYPLWQEEPTIEISIMSGISENPKVTQTINNVDPRTLEDVLYTSPVFAGVVGKEKTIINKMLARAIDFLFDRTGAGGDKAHHTYQTHSMSMDFLARHKRLERCVRHIFEENKNYGISVLNLSPGEMAALCWLMGSSKSDGDVYRNQCPPKESKLDWSLADKAEMFFVNLALASQNKGADKKNLGPLGEVLRALAGLADPDGDNAGGRKAEKYAILARAWDFVKEAGPDAVVPASALKLEYQTDDMGIKHLLPDVNGFLNWFGGCDIGELPRKVKAPGGDGEDPADDADMESRKAEAKAQTAADLKAKVEAKKAALLKNRAEKKANGAKPTVPAPIIGGKK